MAEGLPYNGWPEFIRHGRDKHYYHARKKGVLPPATECLGCREALPVDCVPYHAEEYGPTLEDYWASCVPLCNRCHAMIHARFQTPNRWHDYLAQALSGNIDVAEYPQAKQVATLSSKFMHRKDIAFHAMPDNAPEYFRSLSMEEYRGANKVATLWVTDVANGQKVEVPDWTLYGNKLERLDDTARKILVGRGVNVEGFLKGDITLPQGKDGKLVYKRLYV